MNGKRAHCNIDTLLQQHSNFEFSKELVPKRITIKQKDTNG